MAGMAEDVISRLQQMSSNRLHFERAWQQVAEVAGTDSSDFSSGLGLSSMYSANGSGGQQQATAAKRSRKLYDTTAMQAIDRLGSGIEALAMPQSEYWHGYDLGGLTKRKLSPAEKQWTENVRDAVFSMRYDADSGFVPAVQTAIRRLIGFGNAFFMVEDGIAGASHLFYRYLPLNESFVAEDHRGIIDTFYRHYTLTARQAVQKFGDSVSKAIQNAANSANDAERLFVFIHAIQPRGDVGSMAVGVKDAPTASLHIELEGKRVVHESGYYEFPIIDFRWLPEPGRVYGEGPLMRCLADVQSLNLMARNELRAGQQAVDPPLLVANAGVMNRPNTNPGAINFGGLTPGGQKLIEPLYSGQRLDFATMVLEAKRNQVKDSMYLNLFALLVQNPQMSATEAMIRSNEKGELLGPAGSRLQQSLSRMAKREIAILRRQGMFEKDSEFSPPRSVGDRLPSINFTSPLDRLRKGREVEGTMTMLNVLGPVAQVDPTVVDHFEGDEMVQGLADRLGVPASFIRDPAKVAEIRAQRQQQQQIAQAAEAAKNFAQAGQAGAEAMATGRKAGIL